MLDCDHSSFNQISSSQLFHNRACGKIRIHYQKADIYGPAANISAIAMAVTGPPQTLIQGTFHFMTFV